MARATPVSISIHRNRVWHCLHGLCLAASLLVTAAQAYGQQEDLLWFRDGMPTREAEQAIRILANATEDGLDPADYRSESLSRALMQIAETPMPNPDGMKRQDQALTEAMKRYVSDLHFGRIKPEQIGARFRVPPASWLDPETYLRTAVVNQRLPQAVREAAPGFPFYDNLRRILPAYRQLASHPAWQNPLPPLPGKKLEAGKAYAGLATLAQRLVALGDLPETMPAPQHYDHTLAAGIRSFQKRHGLAADGVIGKMTYEALEVTPARRARQIELTMERLRLTPLMRSSRMVLINVPEFMLRAYVRNGEQIEYRMASKVVVGKALDTRTPIFSEDMRFIEFSPYWNIPRSIARAETVPKIRRDPDYFYREGLEFVTRTGEVSATLSYASLGAVMRDTMRIRQRPGPENALGGIKFIFPNNDNIYLHDTPARQLFMRERRDFSHGCIRIHDPVALATFVLKNEPQWTEERILEAMASGKSKTERLREPLPVVIAYATAVVRNDDRIYFFPDIYGHDRLLDEALQTRGNSGQSSAAPPKTSN